MISMEELRSIVVEWSAQCSCKTCWHNALNEFGCGNWHDCDPSCAMRRLREAAGFRPRKDGELGSPIDLSAFCQASLDDAIYPGIIRPFQVADDPWLYATDGRIAVRVPAAAEPKPITAGRVPLKIATDLPWCAPAAADWAPWPAAEYRTTPGMYCPQCGGSKLGPTNKGEHCDENGDGYYQCVGGATIQRHYDVLIRALSDVHWTLADPDDSHTIILFRFDGGEGLLNQWRKEEKS